MNNASGQRIARRLLTVAVVGGVVTAVLGGVFLGGLYVGDAIGVRGLKEHVRSVVERGPAGQEQDVWKVLTTSLHRVLVQRIDLPRVDRTGGAIEQVGDLLVYALPDGQLGYVRPGGSQSLLDVGVPMNLDALFASPVAERPNFDPQYIRVTDLLAVADQDNAIWLYVGHHRYVDHCVAFSVSRLRVRVEGSELRVQTPRMETVFTARPCVRFRPDGEFLFSGHQSGGRIIRFDQGRLLVSIGDHHFDGLHGMPPGMPEGLPPEHEFPMSADVDLGKVLLLDVATGESTIFTRGMRNPQGLLRDSVGRIWETEHGPQGGDELNLLVQNGNYGWPEVSLGTNYGSLVWPFSPEQGRHEGYVSPLFAWNPSIGINNLVESDGREFPAWRGDLLIASLLQMTLFRVRLSGSDVTYVEPIEVGERIRDAILLDDGRIALYADSAAAILILRNGDSGEVPDNDHAQGSMLDSSPGARVFLARCSACHSLGNEGRIGPRLAGVVGRPIAGGSFHYSRALREGRGRWTRQRLARFVTDPQRMFPGSRMSPVDIGPAELDQLLDFLARSEALPGQSL